jgi:hypothetical protein
MSRRRVPTMAWVLSGGTAVGLVVATVGLIIARGTGDFYREGDAFHYLLIAKNLFGNGHTFVFRSEAAYRYGRVGFPLVAWLFAFGRPGLVDWTLIAVSVAAIAAVPGLAATLLDDNGVPAVYGAVALIPVSLYTLYRDPVADPLMIALILFAFVLDGRGRRRNALLVLAGAVLVKEVAALALVPWMWQALRRKNWRGVGRLLTVLVPYALWCVWVRVRLGEFPFLAHTIQRTEAFGFPVSGMHTIWNEQPPEYVWILVLTIITIVGAFAAAWIGRRHDIAIVAGAFGLLVLCFGPNALRFSFEIGRLLAPAQVFSLVALTLGGYEWHRRRADGNAHRAASKVEAI